MTIAEATVYLTDQLKTIYEDGEAGSISDWVLEHLTGIKKTDRISQRKNSLTDEQLEQLQSHIARLLLHEPVQYVLNEAWFCGLKFYVDKNVLVPRPETEELVEWIITNCKLPVDRLKILDVGSGSGCISIALKRRIGKAEVWACDISQAALQVATRNASNLGVDVKFTEMDFLDARQRKELPVFDIIVSNPPYIPEKEKYQMRPNVIEYEPRIALFVPDTNSLIFYKAIAEFGKTHLDQQGSIYTEIHEENAAAVSALFQSEGYKTEIRKDMQGKERMVLGVRC